MFKHLGFYMYVHVHGASFPNVWCMAASSSPVGVSGMLQCGIRAYVAAWPSMGHEEQVSRGRLPEHSRKKSVNDRKIF